MMNEITQETKYECRNCKKSLEIHEIKWAKTMVYTFDLDESIKNLPQKEQEESFEGMKEYARIELSKMIRKEEWKEKEASMIKTGEYYKIITYPDDGESIYCKECFNKWQITMD